MPPCHPGKRCLTPHQARRRSGPGPGGEAPPQLGDLVRAEPEGGEPPVGQLVQPPARVGEIPAGQAGVQLPGEADQLSRAVALQGGGGVHVVAGLDPAGFSELRPGYRGPSTELRRSLYRALHCRGRASSASCPGHSRKGLLTLGPAHVDFIRECGLVTATAEGRRVRYELADQRLAEGLRILAGLDLPGTCQ